MTYVIEGVKSEAGRREWALTRRAVAAFEAQFRWLDLAREVAGDRWRRPLDDDGEPAELVFPNTRGGILNESNVAAEWHELLGAIGLEGPGKPTVRMHDLRHSKGTLMADEGEETVVIQRTLGHAKASITSDLYIGKVPKALRRAAERWTALLDGEEPAVLEGGPEGDGEAVS